MDIGSVPGEIGILPEYREGYRNPPGAIWAIMGLHGPLRREEGGGQVDAHAPKPKPNWTRVGGRGAPLSFFSSLSFPYLIWRGKERVLVLGSSTSSSNRKRGKEKGKGGPAPLPIRIGLGGARPLPCSFSLPSTKAQ